MLRGLTLCDARPGVSMDWWLGASREDRDALWQAAGFLAEEADKRPRRRGMPRRGGRWR